VGSYQKMGSTCLCWSFGLVQAGEGHATLLFEQSRWVDLDFFRARHEWTRSVLRSTCSLCIVIALFAGQTSSWMKEGLCWVTRYPAFKIPLQGMWVSRPFRLWSIPAALRQACCTVPHLQINAPLLKSYV